LAHAPSCSPAPAGPSHASQDLSCKRDLIHLGFRNSRHSFWADDIRPQFCTFMKTLHTDRTPLNEESYIPLAARALSLLTTPRDFRHGPGAGSGLLPRLPPPTCSVLSRYRCGPGTLCFRGLYRGLPAPAFHSLRYANVVSKRMFLSVARLSARPWANPTRPGLPSVPPSLKSPV